METEVQKTFKCTLDALHPALRQYGVSGSVFFWQYGSISSLRHTQLMDGEVVCGRKKIKGGDGSEDAIMFDGNKFYWCRKNHHNILGMEGREFYIEEIPNPIKCKHCQRWWSKHYR